MRTSKIKYPKKYFEYLNKQQFPLFPSSDTLPKPYVIENIGNVTLGAFSDVSPSGEAGLERSGNLPSLWAEDFPLRSNVFNKIAVKEPPSYCLKKTVLFNDFLRHRLQELAWANPSGISNGVRLCRSLPLPEFTKRYAFPLPASQKRKKRDPEEKIAVRTGNTGYVELYQYGREAYLKDQALQFEKLGDDFKGSDPETKFISYGYKGLFKCHSSLSCPRCAPMIRSLKREKTAAIAALMITKGHSFAFVTHTAPHKYSTDPVKFVDDFQETVRDMKKTRKYRNFLKKWKLIHYIRSIEVTDDAPGSVKKTGIHFHSHSILFFDRKPLSAAEAKIMQKELSIMWTDALIKRKLVEPSEKKYSLLRGTDISRPQVKKLGELSDQNLILKLCEYIAKNVSFELAPSTGTDFNNSNPNDEFNNRTGKLGKTKDRISHWQLMTLALTKDSNLQPRLFHILRALKGRAAISFSKGLVEYSGYKEETKVTEKDEVLIYSFANDTEFDNWYKICYNGKQEEVLHGVGNFLKKHDHEVNSVSIKGISSIIKDVSHLLVFNSPITGKEQYNFNSYKSFRRDLKSRIYKERETPIPSCANFDKKDGNATAPPLPYFLVPSHPNFDPPSPVIEPKRLCYLDFPLHSKIFSYHDYGF